MSRVVFHIERVRQERVRSAGGAWRINAQQRLDGSCYLTALLDGNGMDCSLRTPYAKLVCVHLGKSEHVEQKSSVFSDLTVASSGQQESSAVADLGTQGTYLSV